jgi:phosphoenolpyruvate carboxykinase (GTP)
MSLTNNKAILSWIDEVAALTKPDNIIWIDGSREIFDKLRAR